MTEINPNSLELDLTKLMTPIHKLSKAMGSILFEACTMCLDIEKHTGGVDFTLLKTDPGTTSYLFKIKDWGTVDKIVRDTYNDLQEATELAACGFAFLLIHDLTRYKIIRRSVKGTGFDYWLEEKETADALPFSDGVGSARLEVSGILHNTESYLERRVKEKVEQTFPSDNMGLPAYIVVVEFSKPTGRLVLRAVE